MRKWYVPLTILGLGGLGLLFVTERGQQAVRSLLGTPGDEPGNEFEPRVDDELAQIVSALDEIEAQMVR